MGDKSRGELEKFELFLLPVSLLSLFALNSIAWRLPSFPILLGWFIAIYVVYTLQLVFKELAVFQLHGSLLLALVVLYGPFFALLYDFIFLFFRRAFTQESHHKKIQNLVCKPISYAAGSVVFLLFPGVKFPSPSSIALYLAFFSITLQADVLYVAYFRALEQAAPFPQTLRRFVAKMPVLELCQTLFPIGMLVAYFVRADSPFVLLLVMPILVSRQVLKYLRDLEKEMQTTMNAMTDVLEAKDEYTERHTDRVSKYARIIASHYGLDELRIETVANVAKLHDIGKIMVKDEVLRKPDKLTRDEFEHVKLHVQYDFASNLIPPQFPVAKLLNLVRMHHERYDGKGYPFGLKGEEIPLEVRIVSVADAWDAMMSRRVYREGLPEEEALKILKENSGTQWDPKAVRAFFEAHDAGEIQAISAEYKAFLKIHEWNTLNKLQDLLST